MIKSVLKVLLARLSIAVFIQCLLISFANMDMTEIRLLVTYWKEYLFCCVILVASYLAWRY